jgi:CubicO group peptidase (beta-lactamase class C family)
MTDSFETQVATLSDRLARTRQCAALALAFAASACGGSTRGDGVQADPAQSSAGSTPAASRSNSGAAQGGVTSAPTPNAATGGAFAADAAVGGTGKAGDAAPASSSAGTPAAAPAGSSAPAAGSSGAAAGSAAGSGSAASGTWQWPEGKPEDFGIETAWLDEAADSIQRSTGNRYGMVVVRKGTLLYEKYWEGGPDDKHIIYSCTKSWGSSLIGIAVTQGLLSVTDEIRKYVPMPAQGVSQGATVEHVLTQSAHTDPPGQSFQYNSGYLLNTAPEVLAVAANMTAHEFFDRYLAKPLGLAMTWPECPAGGCAGTRYPEGFIQFGNQPPEAPNEELPLSSVRDQAKLGWLWANNGKWGDEQLIDPSYIAAGSKPGAGFRNMYGYLLWLENAEQFGAIGGVGNCYVNIMPSKQLVIAVMGNDSGLGTGGGWSSFQSLVDRITD